MPPLKTLASPKAMILIVLGMSLRFDRLKIVKGFPFLSRVCGCTFWTTMPIVAKSTFSSAPVARKWQCVNLARPMCASTSRWDTSRFLSMISKSIGKFIRHLQSYGRSPTCPKLKSFLRTIPDKLQTADSPSEIDSFCNFVSLLVPA